MLGLNPKDFDAVTNATPSQIKEVLVVDAELLAVDLNWHMSIQDVS